MLREEFAHASRIRGRRRSFHAPVGRAPLRRASSPGWERCAACVRPWPLAGMAHLLWICLGSAAGGGARYLLSSWLLKLLGPAFPYGTLTVNVLGSFLIG